MAQNVRHRVVAVAGIQFCGALGGRFPKKIVLAGLYFARSAVITLFVLAPTTDASILLFAGAIGMLWLGKIHPALP